MPQNGDLSPRQKGNRTERALRHYLVQRGLTAEWVRCPALLAGASPAIAHPRRPRPRRRGQAWGDGFRELYAWLQSRDLLIVKAAVARGGDRRHGAARYRARRRRRRAPAIGRRPRSPRPCAHSGLSTGCRLPPGDRPQLLTVRWNNQPQKMKATTMAGRRLLSKETPSQTAHLSLSPHPE